MEPPLYEPFDLPVFVANDVGNDMGYLYTGVAARSYRQAERFLEGAAKFTKAA